MAEDKLDELESDLASREDELLELAADPAVLDRLADDARVTESALEPEAEALMLNLEDLLPDGEGEVVLIAEDDLPLSVIAEQPLMASGIVEQHVTATGVDVEGLHFYSFDNGVTLYSDLDIVIVDS